MRTYMGFFFLISGIFGNSYRRHTCGMWGQNDTSGPQLKNVEEAPVLVPVPSSPYDYATPNKTHER